MATSDARTDREFWQDKNVLVTGGNGFVGTWVVEELLNRGAHVVCLVKEWLEGSNFERLGLARKTTVVFGDLLDLHGTAMALDKHEIDTVLHLAAQPLVQLAIKNPLQTLSVNVMGTANLLDACRHRQDIQRIVVASSDKAYGSSDTLPYEECFPLKGEYPYDVSKSCADLIAQSYAKTYDMPIAITRMSNIYGGGDLNFDRIVPETMKSILSGQDILIRSDGKFSREFFYVKDAARAYVTLAEQIGALKLSGEAFNFGTDERVVILDLVNLIIEVSGKTDAKVQILDTARGEIRDQYLSSKKARRMLGWAPAYTLAQSLKETYDWYKDYFDG